MALISYQQQGFTAIDLVSLNPGASRENFPPQCCLIPVPSRLYHTLDVDPSSSIKPFPAHNISAVLAEPEFKAIICNMSLASEADSHSTSPATEQPTWRKQMAAANPASGSREVIAWQGAEG